jgi:hypothetical protein
MVRAEKPSQQPGSRILKIATALSQRNPDGSYAHSYPGDHVFLRRVYRDRLAAGQNPNRDPNSMYGQTKKAIDVAVGRFERMAQGQSDEVGEQLLQAMRTQDPRNASWTPLHAISVLTRENPQGRHKWHNREKIGARPRRKPLVARVENAPKVKTPKPRKEKPTAVATESSAPTTIPDEPRRKRHYSGMGGFDNRGRIQLEDLVIPITTPPQDSIRFHSLWPKRNLTQVEKYAYAMSIPGESSDWHFATLRDAVIDLNSGVLDTNADGVFLTPDQREEKIDELTQGAQNVLNAYFVTKIKEHRELFNDPTKYAGVPQMVRDYIHWGQFLDVAKRPTFDEYLARLKGIPVPEVEQA